MKTTIPRNGGITAVLVLFAALFVAIGAKASGNYTTVVFSDGFESGDLSAWNVGGNGTATVVSDAPQTGAYAARLTNTSGQYQVLVKQLADPLIDSSTQFAVRVSSSVGVQEIAEAKDAGSSQSMWALFYDGNAHAFWFFPRDATHGIQIFTGGGSVPLGSWTQVEVQYTASATGGAQLYLNGQTQPDWGATGDFTRSSYLQRLQLWNDGANTVDFDDVSVNVPPSQQATAPGAPMLVTGTAGDGSVALNWTAPASDGGASISSYRITPYIGSNAQTPIQTASPATSATVGGLTNGTAYTFTVAATNSVGTGADSAPSSAITPVSSQQSTVPDAPTGVAGNSGDQSVSLHWSAPANNGGAAITSYRITPYIGSSAQTPVSTGSAATSYTVTGLTNGTAYTFTVAATNSVGTGAASAASAAVTPNPRYPSVVFRDDFETGTLTGWSVLGTGSANAVAAAAHNGSYGARLNNVSGQYGLLARNFANPMVDSQTSFAVRIGSAAGVEEIAQARDAGSGVSMWALFYDGAHQGFYFYPANSTGHAQEVYTGNNTAAPGDWNNVVVEYTGTQNGGAQLYINGQTQPSWGASGDFTHGGANLQRLQLWDDAANAVDFDDIKVAQPAGQGPGLSNAPTAVTAAPGDQRANVSWTAPGSDGGAAITGYRITPYIGNVAQPAIMTPTNATSYAVTGLTNGTAYTFTVAAVNPVGISSDSAASAAVTPSVGAATVPGTPTNVSGSASDGMVSLTWTAPTSDGGSSITGYRITPYIGATAQQAVLTNSSSTGYSIGGLSNGTTYTFSVAAINSRGTGADSAPSGAVTPTGGSYSSVVFSDGFESGNVTMWPGGNFGPGSASVTGTAAHTGNFGLRLSNGVGQYDVLVKTFSSVLIDSQTSFWLRVGSAVGVQEIAQARDQSSSQTMWTLYYDGNRQGFYFYPTNGAGAGTEVFTGNGSAPVGMWMKIGVQYTAVANGGAQLYINGQTQQSWGVSGDYSRTNNFQKLQIWNDAANTVDFDDVRVAIPPYQPPGPPGAPTQVTGVPDDGQVSLNWTAPDVDGGGIVGYRVTPYVNGTPQTPVETNSAATSALVTGLHNGTAYTFTVAAESSVGPGPESAASASVTPQVLNNVQRENLQAGDPNWGNFSLPTSETALAAYGSQISVNHGQSIDFYVTTTAGTVAIDIYRMGWYGGAGARHMASLGNFAGVNQPQAQPTAATGMIAENWSRTATLNVPSNWVSGVYVARVLNSAGYGTYVTFTVRNDGGHEAIDFQTSVNTWQAYNLYGGASLYNNATDHSIYRGVHATKVSFDRPFANGNGTGDFLRFEYPFVRWLEKNGYDVTYTTDVDTSTNANPITNHKAFLVVGHDEYWSKGMRDNVESAIANGVNVGFFGGNEAFWQVRYEPSSAGVANRVVVGYKDFSDDPTVSYGPDPMWNVNNSVLTTLWRDPQVGRPEESMMGVMFGGEVSNSSPDSSVPGTINYNMIVQNASHWIYEGTGWVNGTEVPALVGYEYDHLWNDSHTPANITVLSNTPLTNSETGQSDTANSTIYTAPSGAMVFAAGTIQWDWALDSVGGGPAYVNGGIQRTTANILARFTQ